MLGPGLRELGAKHPLIGEVRGVGVFWALDLVVDQDDARTRGPATIGALKGDLMSRGLLPFVADNRLHVVPPCVITPDEARRGLAILDDAFTALSA